MPQLVAYWRRDRARERLRQALTRGPTTAALLTSLALSSVLLVTGSPAGAAILLVLGVAFYAASVGSMVIDGDRATRPLLPPAIRPPHAGGVVPDEILSEPLRELYVAILRRYERLLQILAEADDDLAPTLRAAVAGCDDLVDEAGRTARSANELAAYLTAPPDDLVDEARAEELLERAQRVRDDDASEAYLQAAELATRHAEIRAELMAAADRAEARLAAIDAVIALITARLVRLQSRWVAEPQPVPATEIEALEAELAIVESSIREVG
jgi:hypothetical protein